jgi:uncharacterized membrane protein YagU involved in acid resistance
MWIAEGILAGLIAGVIMGLISQIGYWTGILKSHLVIIDGKFALEKIRTASSKPAVYAAGILIHLVTSMVFGVVYEVIAKLIGFEIRNYWAITLYVFLLWLAMLVVALPLAGQGFLGKKIHGYVWLEQLILHIVFGFSFWWALGVI